MRDTLYPLSIFCESRGIPCPTYYEINPDDMEEPFRGLLCHDGDMTSRLRDFHGGELTLTKIHGFQEGKKLFREVALRRKSDGLPVEYGAIRISLKRFSDDLRERITGGNEPLGKIITESKMPFVSKPLAYVQVVSDRFINKALGLPRECLLYGRCNELTTPNGKRIARIVEILPPLEYDPSRTERAL